jgi:hypothetical protein
MSTVPYIFADNTGNIPLSQLDTNFANVKLSVDYVIQNVQANINSVGTLTSLSVSGNITHTGNLLITGAIIDSSQLDIQTSANNANIALAPNGNGQVTISTQLRAVSNITGGNLLTSGLATVTGNITGGNLLTSGLATVTGNITGGNLLTSGLVSATANVTGGNLLTSGAISAGGNITGNNLFTTGVISASGNISSQNVFACNIFNTNANGVGNIGNASTYFNTAFVTATSAEYADLAEKYESDQEYAIGTVVIFGGEKEITASTKEADARVAGVISQNPAHLMNAGGTGLPVALRGKVPVKLVGPVEKGDSLVTSAQPGFAKSIGTDLSYAQAVFAKSLESCHDLGEKIITAVIL